jgi:hypothetical protein
MIEELIKIANELDSRGLPKEADLLDSLVKLSTELDSPEGFGELVDLDKYRKKKKDQAEGRRTPEEYKSYLAENWPEIQKAIDALDETSPEDMFFHLIVLDDDETYSSEASIVKATPEQMEQIEEGQKVYDVVPPSQWQDVWNLISSEDV